MSLNVKCPNCGSRRVQLSFESGNHGCLYLILFGFVYLIWILIKWCIGITILICLDWWMAIICNLSGKGYVWHCRKWFTNSRKTYYCHDCGYNFKM